VTTTNIRAVGLVLTVLNHFHLFPSGPLAQTAEGARRITYFVAQSNHGWPISPRWFLAGQPSGVGACLHKSSPHEQPGGHFPEFSPSRTKLFVARSPDLATSATEGQVTNPDAGGKLAVKQAAGVWRQSGDPRRVHRDTVHRDTVC